MNDRAVIALACQIAKLRDKARMWKQTALAYENEGMSARADAVTRAEADRVRMEALRDELRREREAHAGLKDALGIQAAKEAGKVLGMIDGEGLRGAAERVVKQRDALRADVKDLRTLCDQWKQRETELLAEVERLKKPARQHPVQAGERNGQTPKLGDKLRLVTQPPGWSAQWGKTGDVATVAEANGIVFKMDNGYTWPLSCIEVVTEATHDTPEGRSVAESVIRDDRNTEPDEIKVGDLVEVYQATAVCTRQDDIGSRGIVEFADECVSLTPVDGFKAAQENHVGLCDVRKVTT